MADSYTKKEFGKKKIKKRKDKEEKRIFKKANNNKGKSLEEMFIYVDINGQFTTVPPHLQIKEETATNKKVYKGIVTHMNDKGFGFIKEELVKESIFYHTSDSTETLKINDIVLFTKIKTERGFKALQINKEY